MYEKIQADIISALKEKNTLKLQTLRGIKGSVDLEHINSKAVIDDNLVIDIISRGIKTRKESIQEFEKGNREDLIAKTKEEIALLQEYLPAQLTSDELENIIASIFEKVKPTSNKDMGLIMKELTPLVKGKCDMKEVSTIIKDKLNNL